MPIIELPDGQHAEFPDDMSQDQIRAVLQKKFPRANVPQQEQPGLLHRAGDWAERNVNQPMEQQIINPAKSMGAGFTQGLLNVIPGALNLGVSGINALGGNVPKVPMIDSAPHDISAQIGNVGSFFAGPGMLKGMGKIPEIASMGGSAMKSPMIAETLQKISNALGRSPVASRIAGNALLGGAYDPDHPLVGMALGGGAGALGEAASKGMAGIKDFVQNNNFLKNMTSKIRPESHAKELENYLSEGANNVTNNSKSLVSDIRNAHDARNEEASIFLNHALSQAGDKKIYEYVNPLISTALDKSESTLSKIKDLNVGDLYSYFKSNPTFRNAHNLQSELGTMIGDLKQIPHKTPDESNQLRLIESARDQLKNDISDFLVKFDENVNIPIRNTYQKGIDLYRENVAPYLSSEKLRDIVRGRKTDVKNVHGVFDTPTNTITKEGIEKIGPVNKIMQDLPQNFKNKLLFNAIGGNKKDANALLESLLKVKSKGYGSYFTPEVDESINSLNQKMKNKKLAGTAAKIAGAGSAIGLTGGALHHLF